MLMTDALNLNYASSRDSNYPWPTEK